MQLGAPLASLGDRAEGIVKTGLGFTTRMLQAAMCVGEVALLADEMTWAKDRLPHDGVSMQLVLANLQLMRTVISEMLDPAHAREVLEYVDWMIETTRPMVQYG